MSPDDPRHGTNAGYLAHRRTNEPACVPCRAGRARFERFRRYDSELGRPRKLPSLGARRRVHALQRMGWSLRMIAADAGWNSPEALQYVMRSASIQRRSWMRIAETYDRLSMKIPPTCSATIRARNRAERLGYPPPLAWDDIDDPNEQPAQAEKVDGRRTVDRILENAEWLADGDASLTEVIDRLGVGRNTLRDLLRREGRGDLYWRLANREPDAEDRRAVRDGIKRSKERAA